jgi:hypothetical protein
MESVGSGEHSEVEPVQDGRGVVESFSVCPENPTRNDFGPLGVRFFRKG